MPEAESIGDRPRPLQEGRDYTRDGQGRWIFTARHLKGRGSCCFQACRNCPWGQAGRSPAEAAADLQARLERLEERLRLDGMEVKLIGYRLGVLRARSYQVACQAGVAELDRLVRERAEGLLTVTGVEWDGVDR